MLKINKKNGRLEFASANASNLDRTKLSGKQTKPRIEPFLMPDTKTILVEFIEVLIHQIIKLERIYPDGIYVKRRKYNLALFMSEHPSVNEFIKEITEGIKKKLSDPEEDIEGLALVISRGNKTYRKFSLMFPGAKSLKIDRDTENLVIDEESKDKKKEEKEKKKSKEKKEKVKEASNLDTDKLEDLDTKFASLLLRFAEVMKDLREGEKEEDGEKKEWWGQLESALPGQTDIEAVRLDVFDFKKPFPLQFYVETYQ